MGYKIKGKKALALKTLVELFIVTVIIIALVLLIMKLTTKTEDQTTNSFKTLAKEVQGIADELDKTNKTEIIIPIYIDKTRVISALNKDSLIYPEICKGEPCLQLYDRVGLKVISAKPIKDVEFRQKDEGGIRVMESGIINVNITGEKTDSKKIVTIEQISGE
jgi:hypothetical protein